MWSKHRRTRAFLPAFFLLTGLWLLLSLPLSGQTLKKQQRPAALWMQLNMEYYLKKGSFFFFESGWHYRPSFRFDDIRGLPFYQLQHLLGYEQHFNRYWSGGLLAQWRNNMNGNSLISRVYMVHNGRIKSLEFVKQLSLDRIDYFYGQLPAESRMGLAASLSRNFSLGKKALRPVVAYEAFVISQWLGNKHPVYEKRPIDKTFLRLELACLLRPQLSLSLFYLRETDFYWSIGGTDKDGKIIPEHKLNTITSVLGFRIHHQFSGKTEGTKIKSRVLSY